MAEVACGNNEESARVDYPGDVGENDSAIPLIPTHVGLRIFRFNRGPVAQLGARFHGMEEVVGSIPTRSTNQISHFEAPPFRDFVAFCRKFQNHSANWLCDHALFFSFPEVVARGFAISPSFAASAES
jgi:hypothetical protein